MNSRKPNEHAEDRAEAPVLCIVDDDASTVGLVRDIAEESGWIAYDFARLEELRGFLHRRRPALLILDDDLPDGRGGDLARELLDDPDTADVPTVVCTAAPAKRRSEIGAWVPVIPKPFRISEIEQVLQTRAPQARSQGDAAR